MSYQNYPQINSTTLPSSLIADTQTANISDIPNITNTQALQYPSQLQNMQPSQYPIQALMPPQFNTLYNPQSSMYQPSLMSGYPNNAFIETSEKGWSLINIILLLLLLFSCILSIYNFMEGEVLGGVCCIFSLCVFYWIYSYYNMNSSIILQKLPNNLGGINITIR